MDKHNFIPTIYQMVIVLASLAVFMKWYPKMLGVTVLVLFLFYLSKVWSSR